MSIFRARAHKGKIPNWKNKNSRAKRRKEFLVVAGKTYPSRPSLRIIGFVIEYPRSDISFNISHFHVSLARRFKVMCLRVFFCDGGCE